MESGTVRLRHFSSECPCSPLERKFDCYLSQPICLLGGQRSETINKHGEHQRISRLINSATVDIVRPEGGNIMIDVLTYRSTVAAGPFGMVE